LNTICNSYHYLDNYRNLPVTVKLVNKVEVTYFYDAEGTKLLRKVKQANGITQETSYEGSFVYQTDANNKLALSYFAHTQGGRVTVTNNQYKYEYFLGDNLGNVRATFGAPSVWGGCFVKGSKFLMADGTWKKIEKIKVGEYVKSYNIIKKKIKNR